MRQVRDRRAGTGAKRSGDAAYNDVNYVFPTFITTQTAGGAGRAADRGDLRRRDVDDRRRALGALDRLGHRLLPALHPGRRRAIGTSCRVSKLATVFWGLFASVVAVWAAELGSLIEVVNRFGSFFYGSILGVFILASRVPARHRQRRVRRSARRHGRGGVDGLSPSRRWRSSGTTSSARWRWSSSGLCLTSVERAVTKG